MSEIELSLFLWRKHKKYQKDDEELNFSQKKKRNKIYLLNVFLSHYCLRGCMKLVSIDWNNVGSHYNDVDERQKDDTSDLDKEKCVGAA